MTVEVLGTVLGTAIQGQIVGQADTPCLQDPSDSARAMEGANRTQSTTSLRETVRPLAVQRFGETKHNGGGLQSSSTSSMLIKCWAFDLETVNMPTFQIAKLTHREAK